MSKTKIERLYDPENDLCPNGPRVRWAEYELQKQVIVLNNKMSQLQEQIVNTTKRAHRLQSRIEELEEKEKGREKQRRWPDRPLPLSEAAEYLGVTPGYLYKLTSKRKIAHYKPRGKKIYFLREDLNEYLKTNRIRMKTEEVEE